jgi:hypothetical protein
VLRQALPLIRATWLTSPSMTQPLDMTEDTSTDSSYREFAGTLVRIVVGTEELEKTFTVHKNVFTKASRFFSAAFDG